MKLEPASSSWIFLYICHVHSGQVLEFKAAYLVRLSIEYLSPPFNSDSGFN